jgi:hypothetical protein
LFDPRQKTFSPDERASSESKSGQGITSPHPPGYNVAQMCLADVEYLGYFVQAQEIVVD